MAQPSGHDFYYREPSIGKGWNCADRSGAFASKLAPTRAARAFVGASLLANEGTVDRNEKQIVYNFRYLTGTIYWFFENIQPRAVTAMRHGVAERRN
jgi:hypothetical protein